MQRNTIIAIAICVASFVAGAVLMYKIFDTAEPSRDVQTNIQTNCTAHNYTRAYDNVKEVNVEYNINCVCDFVIDGREYHREFDDVRRFEYVYAITDTDEYLTEFDCVEHCRARCAGASDEIK